MAKQKLMTNIELVAKLRNVADNHKTVYGLGMYGHLITDAIIDSKAKQLPNFYTAAKVKKLRSLVGKNYFGFDCLGLVEGIFWGWTGNVNDSKGGAVYGKNDVPDTNAAGIIKMCEGVSSIFADIKVGELLWMPGHVGVYIGNGQAIEATPQWDDDVQYSNVANLGNDSGHSRAWQKHGKLPWIEYVEVNESKEPTVATAVTVGSAVTIAAGATYYNSTNKVPDWVLKKQWVVKSVSGSRVVVDKSTDGGSSICSAIDAKYLSVAGTTNAAQKKVLKVGSAVTIAAGATYYNSTNKVPDWVLKKQWVVKSIIGSRVVVDKSTDGKSSICSAIAVHNLTVV